MKVVIQTDNGKDVAIFTVPKTSGITKEQAHKMGENIAEAIEEGQAKYDAWYQKQLDTCTCRWKDKPEPERSVMMVHSGSCKTWEIE